jgi:hypothetical protein
MPASSFCSTSRFVLAAVVAMGLSACVLAAPVTQIGDLAAWDPNRPGDLPKSLAGLDPNAVVLAKDTLDVLPDMLTKMETVILNLTAERTHARLDELFAGIMADAKTGRPDASGPVHAFVVGQIAAKLKANQVMISLAEMEALVAAVDEGPAREFVDGLAKQGIEMPLAELLALVEKRPKDVRSFFRPTVMSHLEHGHVGFFAGLCACESADPWSIPLDELRDEAKAQSKAVQDYVNRLPVWLVEYRISLEAPDVPLHQLLDMLARARQAYHKMTAAPLVVEKDLQAPSKVAYMLQEAYARSEQINMDLVSRDVIGVMIVGTLLVLLSALRGYINMLNVPNRRITE